MPAVPLSVQLSHLLVAFTIELDNEFERRMEEAAPSRPFRVSIVMWSNFLRFVGSGIPVGELPAAAGLPKARVLSTLGGMERWGYVFVAPSGTRKPPATRREGFGSARGLRSDWVVRPTGTGIAAQGLWSPLLREIEDRWCSRFGADAVGALRNSLSAVVERLEPPLPEYLPIVTGTNGMVSEVTAERPRPSDPVPLSAVLAQALLGYTLDLEREAPLSLPLAENVMRRLGEKDIDVGELSRAAAVSPEAVSMSLSYLKRCVFVEGTKVVRLTEAGRVAADATHATHATVETAWEQHLGRVSLERMRAAMQAILDQRDGDRSRLALGLEPHPNGWRASGRYLPHTQAMLADPVTGLPRHPMVLHRGGWPDGS